MKLAWSFQFPNKWNSIWSDKTVTFILRSNGLRKLDKYAAKCYKSQYLYNVKLIKKKKKKKWRKYELKWFDSPSRKRLKVPNIERHGLHCQDRVRAKVHREDGASSEPDDRIETIGPDVSWLHEPAHMTLRFRLESNDCNSQVNHRGGKWDRGGYPFVLTDRKIHRDRRT